MAHKHSSTPEWLPFAIVASGLVMIGAGIRSGWKTASSEPPPPPPPQPPVRQAGVLHDWIGSDGMLRELGGSERWFFWYGLPFGATQFNAVGPEQMTDQEAFNLEFRTKQSSLGTQLYRFVWIPAEGVWIYDTRNDPALLASREIRDARGVVVG